LTGAVLGIDPGSRRIGVAISDPGGKIALPVTVIERGSDDSYLARLADLARQRQAREVVVGLPRRLDGSDGPEALEARALADRLREMLGLPVHLFDERFTSKISESAMRTAQVSSRKQRPVVDKIAATVLLQGFLDLRSAKPHPSDRQDGVAY
jgi:putative Holliday junction resolvase